MWDAETERLYPTAYQREQAMFAEMERDLQARKRRRWRLWLGLMIAGRHRQLRRGRLPPGRQAGAAPICRPAAVEP